MRWPNRAFGNIAVHSENGRFVVITTSLRSSGNDLEQQLRGCLRHRHVMQGHAGPANRPGPHHRDGHRVVSFPENAGKEERRQGMKQHESAPDPRSALRPKRVALRAPQGFAQTGDRELIHQGVGPNQSIERGQIKLTEPSIRNRRKPATITLDHRSPDRERPVEAPGSGLDFPAVQ